MSSYQNLGLTICYVASAPRKGMSLEEIAACPDVRLTPLFPDLIDARFKGREVRLPDYIVRIEGLANLKGQRLLVVGQGEPIWAYRDEQDQLQTAVITIPNLPNQESKNWCQVLRRWLEKGEVD